MKKLAVTSAALKELPNLAPKQYRQVFWLSCVDGLPHDRIAAQLRTSPGAVRMLLSRARADLARSLNESPFPLRSEP